MSPEEEFRSVCAKAEQILLEWSKDCDGRGDRRWWLTAKAVLENRAYTIRYAYDSGRSYRQALEWWRFVAYDHAKNNDWHLAWARAIGYRLLLNLGLESQCGTIAKAAKNHERNLYCDSGRFVYFIEATGSCRIKIGSAGDPVARLREMQTGSPYELKLLVFIPGGYALEQELHERFARLRDRGEWFIADAEIFEFIETARVGLAA